MLYVCTVNCPKLQSFQGLRPLDRYQGSPLDLLGAYSAPRPPAVKSNDRWLLPIVLEAQYGKMYAVHYWPHSFSAQTRPIFYIPAQKSINPSKQKKVPKNPAKNCILAGSITRVYYLKIGWCNVYPRL